MNYRAHLKVLGALLAPISVFLSNQAGLAVFANDSMDPFSNKTESQNVGITPIPESRPRTTGKRVKQNSVMIITPGGTAPQIVPKDSASDWTPANLRQAEEGSPQAMADHYASKLRAVPFVELVKANVAALPGTDEAAISSQILRERLPQTPTAQILAITDCIEPGDGLYYALYTNLKQRGIDPICRINTPELIAFLEDGSLGESWRNVLLREFSNRVPKLKDTQIAALLKALPPMSQVRNSLLMESRSRGSSRR